MTILLTIAAYFSLLLLVSRFTGKGGNDAFFRGNHESPWPLVAFGMIGASLSGVTFISVPGMVSAVDMTYLQMCLGFFFGYLLVAFVLLPLYYRYGLTSIYGFLASRLGEDCHKTGAWFFLVSKLTGAAARLYLVCLILQQYAFGHTLVVGGYTLQVPFVAVVLITLLLIWLYTRKSGIKALVWTDSLQTLCLIAALLLMLWQATSMLGCSLPEAFRTVWNDPHSRMFEWDDWGSRQHFVKQFLSGIFIVIVMTGLDQDMMQKNLTCRNLRDGQKDLCCYGALFFPVNFLFLALGILVVLLYAHNGVPLPAKGDELLPQIVTSGLMGQGVQVLFTIGIIASAFSSADSALTALTTTFCIDILGIENDCTANDARSVAQRETVRKRVHVGVIAVFVAFILAFKAIGSSSVLDAIYTLASYTYGPLLGLFAFAMTSRRHPRGWAVPVVCVAAPLSCYLLDMSMIHLYDYHFGYELLMLNGLLVYAGLFLVTRLKGADC